MKKKFLILALVALFTMPCVLRADEVEIQLMEVISLFNINGQEVLKTAQTQIDISHIPNGIYIIRAITKDGEILQKKLIHE